VELPLKRLLVLMPLREAVARIALAVGENGLIAESGIAARAAEEIRMDARTHDGELGETSGPQGRLLNGQLVDNVAIGCVHLIHQRCGGYLNGAADGTDLKRGVSPQVGTVMAHELPPTEIVNE
jgi:hypothetical protein